jgi:hypothetical protein
LALALFGAGYFTAMKQSEAAMAKQASTDQAKYDELLGKYNSAIAAANTTAQGNSTVLAAGVDVITNNLNKENQNAKNVPSKPLVFHAATSAVNAGSVYSITTANQNGQRPSLSVQSNGNPSVAQGTGDQAVCRLDDATGQALHSITQDGDAAIRQLNAVIDAYNLVQKVGCSVTPATREEIGSLLDGTPFAIKDVTPPESQLFTVDKLKEGVLTIAPYILKAAILP